MFIQYSMDKLEEAGFGRKSALQAEYKLIKVRIRCSSKPSAIRTSQNGLRLLAPAT